MVVAQSVKERFSLETLFRGSMFAARPLIIGRLTGQPPKAVAAELVAALREHLPAEHDKIVLRVLAEAVALLEKPRAKAKAATTDAPLEVVEQITGREREGTVTVVTTE